MKRVGYWERSRVGYASALADHLMFENVEPHIAGYSVFAAATSVIFENGAGPFHEGDGHPASAALPVGTPLELASDQRLRSSHEILHP